MERIRRRPVPPWSLVLGCMMMVFGASACGQTARNTMAKIQIPFYADTRECYQDLKETDRVWQDGFAAMVKAAESDEDFPRRLRNVLEILRETVQAGHSRPPVQPWMEGDVFSCCAEDLLAAMFAAEAQRRAEEHADPDARETARRTLLQELEGIPWDYPQWREVIRPRIEREIDRRLGGSPGNPDGGQHAGD